MLHTASAAPRTGPIPWGPEKTPFVFSDHFLGVTRGFQVSNAFVGMFGETAVNGLTMAYENCEIHSFTITTPTDHFSMINQTRGDHVHLFGWSLFSVARLIRQQIAEEIDLLNKEGTNILYATQSGDFGRFSLSGGGNMNKDEEVRHTAPSTLVAILLTWDSLKKIWFIDIQSVENPMLWPTGTHVYHFYFTGL